MTTARDIVTLSLKDAGVLGIGQTPNAEDTNDAFTTLNQMISEWALSRWLIYSLTDTGVVSTGAQSYTVGPSGSYNLTKRPDSIESAYVRQVNVASPALQPDYPLEVIRSREDYSAITLKQMGPFPYAVWYNPTTPLGALFPWPVPQATIYEVHILTKEVLARFTSLDTTITLPEVYEGALRYNLAARLFASYPVQPRKMVLDLAASTLSVIRASTFAPMVLKMPRALKRPAIYNIYSDQSH